MSKTINNSVNCNPVTSRGYAFGMKELSTAMVTWLQLHTTEEPVNNSTYKECECNLIDNNQRTPK
ncbi:MAG: hypothetical protein SPK35_07645 [Prevotella sp.]|nr:hypothetical protein [Prevotella sp.]